MMVSGRSLILAVSLMLAVFAGCIEKKSYQQESSESPVSARLKAILLEGETARQNPDADPTSVAEMNFKHRQFVYESLSKALITEPEDLYRAAVVLHQIDPESGRETYLLAHYLARAAALEGLDDARYLTAVALDRYMVAFNLPQKYGTQYDIDENGKYVLWPVDPEVTDDERAVWFVPPMDTILANIERLNRQ